MEEALWRACAAPACLIAALFAACAGGPPEIIIEGDAATETVEIEGYPPYFNKRITDGLEKVQEGQYAAALQRLALPYNHKGDTPLDYRHDDFLKEKHPDKTVAAVEAALSAAKGYARQYMDGQEAMDALGSAFTAAVREARYADAAAELAAIRRTLEPLAAARNGLMEQGHALEETFLILRTREEVEDSSHLSYASKLILGTMRTGHTGAIGAIDAQWEAAVGGIIQPLYERAAEAGDALAAALAPEGLFAAPLDERPAQEAFAAFQPLAELLAEAEQLNGLLAYRDGASQKDYYEARIAAAGYLRQLAENVPPLLALRAPAVALDAAPLPPPLDAEQAAGGIRDGTEVPAAAYLARAGEYAALAAIAAPRRHKPWADGLRNLPRTVERWEAEEVPRWDALREACSAAWDAAYDATDGTVRSLLGLLADMLPGGARSIYEEDAAAYRAFASLIPEDPLAPQYPARLLATIAPFQKQLRSDAQALQKAAPALEGGHPYIAEECGALRQDMARLIADMAALGTGAAGLRETARENQRAALAARNEVDQFYNQAVAANEKDDQALARQRLERANATYLRDIDLLRLDADTQSETYARLAALKQEMADKQMPLLIREVRGLKNGAKRSYYAGSFEEAGNYIAQADAARENWSAFMDITLEPDAELERLRGLVNTALSIRSGRTLNPNSPLYPETSQMLSIASQYYAQAQELLRQGRAEEGRELLEQAQDKLNELKIVFPHNQDANLLAMRIDRVLDREQFNAAFRARLEELRRVNYRAQDSLAQISYSDLLDLLAIEPDYPGLKQLIYDVELDMGLRQRPVDDSAARQARALAARAQEGLDGAGRDAVLLADIRAVAEQALALNPDDPLALQVLDEVALRTGAQAAVVLSPEDEEKYQRAITYLQNGDVVSANATLQELLANSGNRSSAKILKLQNRIEGMLH